MNSMVERVLGNTSSNFIGCWHMKHCGQHPEGMAQEDYNHITSSTRIGLDLGLVICAVLGSSSLPSQVGKVRLNMTSLHLKQVAAHVLAYNLT